MYVRCMPTKYMLMKCMSASRKATRCMLLVSEMHASLVSEMHASLVSEMHASLVSKPVSRTNLERIIEVSVNWNIESKEGRRTKKGQLDTGSRDAPRLNSREHVTRSVTLPPPSNRQRPRCRDSSPSLARLDSVCVCLLVCVHQRLMTKWPYPNWSAMSGPSSDSGSGWQAGSGWQVGSGWFLFWLYASCRLGSSWQYSCRLQSR
jgi:hypothetical protein